MINCDMLPVAQHCILLAVAALMARTAGPSHVARHTETLHSGPSQTARTLDEAARQLAGGRRSSFWHPRASKQRRNRYPPTVYEFRPGW
jgi:hypothetical protein